MIFDKEDYYRYIYGNVFKDERVNRAAEICQKLNGRHKHKVNIKKALCYILYTEYNLPVCVLSSILKKDHSVIIYYIKDIEGRLEFGPTKKEAEEHLVHASSLIDGTINVDELIKDKEKRKEIINSEKYKLQVDIFNISRAISHIEKIRSCNTVTEFRNILDTLGRVKKKYEMELIRILNR